MKRNAERGAGQIGGGDGGYRRAVAGGGEGAGARLLLQGQDNPARGGHADVPETRPEV